MSTSTRSGSKRLLAAVGAGAMFVTAGAALTPSVSFASSHREALAISGDPRADNTDTYAFVSPDKPNTVTLLANWIPFEDPNGGPNYYPFATDARYNIKIDNDGDGKADVVYTWKFKNHVRDATGEFLYNTGVVNHLHSKNLNFFQTYTLTVYKHGKLTTLLQNKRVAPSDVGQKSMPDYGQLRDESIAEGQLPNGGGQNYVGQADDPFFLDLRVFDLLYGADLSETGQDSLDGYNVNTIALQVPKRALALHGHPGANPVIGVWSTTDRRAATRNAKWVQVSRLGNPLVNEAVIPLKYKDAFNSIAPNVDHTIAPVVAKVKDPIVPKLIQAIYGIQAPATPRNDLVEIFLTGICKACGPINADLNSQLLNADVVKKHFIPAEELRLNTSIAPTASPNRLGVIGGDLQGFPNGRRLGDDVIDIALQALEGAAQTGVPVAALANGDGVDANDSAFGTTFPYVALPHSVAVNQTSSTVAVPPAGGGNGGGFGSTRVTIAAAAALAALLAMAMAVVSRRRRVVST